MTAAPFIKTSSTKTSAETVFPPPVEPATKVCVCSWSMSKYAYLLDSAINPMLADLGPDLGNKL